jgi:osmotically-inducible protein OsmY
MLRLQRILQVVACIGLLSAFLGCAATQKHESTGQYVDDSVITTKVKAAIFEESSLKTLQINVKSNKGVVQLNGSVDSLESVSKAGEIAQRVENVIAVENNLIVK